MTAGRIEHLDFMQIKDACQWTVSTVSIFLNSLLSFAVESYLNSY